MKPLTERMTKGGAAKSWIKEVEAKDREIESLEQTKDQYLDIIDLLAREKEGLAEENAELKREVERLRALFKPGDADLLLTTEVDDD